MIRRSFITKSLTGNEECTFGEFFKSTTTTCRNNITNTITNQPIQDLRCRCSTNGCLAEYDFFSFVLCNVNGIMLCCTHKSGYLFGVCFIGVFIYVSTKKGEYTFLREI